MSSKSTRRDFLKGKSATRTVRDLAQGAMAAHGAAGPGMPPPAASYLIQVTRRAMACQFEVSLNAGQYAQGTEAALEALEIVSALEDQMSVFRPESEISRLNRTAADAPVELEPRLFGLLELAWRLSEETGGAFDVTSAPLWKAWGFARREGAVPSENELARALACVGARLVELDPEHRSVRFLKPGVAINLGSIAKGEALDRCAEHLADAGVEDFLLEGGQSSVLARGTRMEPSGEPGGWVVGVRDPVRPNTRLAEIRLSDQALATSGSARQYFRHQGRRLGHILDPRSGQPAEGVYSATVVASTAAVADALATAFCVMGPEAALAHCQSRPELAAMLVCPGPRGSGVEIVSSGFDEDRLKMLV